MGSLKGGPAIRVECPLRPFQGFPLQQPAACLTPSSTKTQLLCRKVLVSLPGSLPETAGTRAIYKFSAAGRCAGRCTRRQHTSAEGSTCYNVLSPKNTSQSTTLRIHWAVCVLTRVPTKATCAVRSRIGYSRYGVLETTYITPFFSFISNRRFGTIFFRLQHVGSTGLARHHR